MSHAPAPARNLGDAGGVDTFRASDLTDEHLGRRLRADGVDGVLTAIAHRDDVYVDLALDRDPFVIRLPAGRPVELTSP